ncbi:MAG TPA: hypothetical protein VGK67_26415 [Myxococcales bacterium]|jgi:hypothetical protein
MIAESKDHAAHRRGAGRNRQRDDWRGMKSCRTAGKALQDDPTEARDSETPEERIIRRERRPVGRPEIQKAVAQLEKIGKLRGRKPDLVEAKLRALLEEHRDDPGTAVDALTAWLKTGAEPKQKYSGANLRRRVTNEALVRLRLAGVAVDRRLSRRLGVLRRRWVGAADRARACKAVVDALAAMDEASAGPGGHQLVCEVVGLVQATCRRYKVDLIRGAVPQAGHIHEAVALARALGADDQRSAAAVAALTGYRPTVAEPTTPEAVLSEIQRKVREDVR